MFGAGYVGLVQAAVLAEAGYDAVCMDVDAGRVERLNQGEIPIHEPGLEQLVRDNHKAGRLRFTTDAVEAATHGRIQFIAVGTPQDEDGSADLKYVLSAADAIGRHMDSGKIVVVKSTVPVGTGDKVRQVIASRLRERGREDIGFDVASNPEFLKEGSAVSDCMRPDRIVIGTTSPDTEAVMRELYAPFNRNHEKIMIMDVASAELTKYAANCMLATKITFMNEMARLADLLGADIEQVRKGIGSDPRIGYHFIYSGIGYGGSCFPKDIRAMIRIAEDAGFEPEVLNAVQKRNELQKTVLFEKVVARLGADLRGRTFAVWGLAFKPNTDDMREAPSRVIIEALWAAGATVRAFDPVAADECQRIYGERSDLVLAHTKEEALEGADALVICTEWKNFLAPDFDQIRDALSSALIFDGRNIYDPKVVARHGLEYFAIGRGNSVKVARLQQRSAPAKGLERAAGQVSRRRLRS
jgi:UDPglucose 6-dehydrogenase